MSAEEKNKLDELFKQGLGTPDHFAEYDDQDWDGLEQLLDAGRQPRGIVYWLPRLGAVAAVLLLFLGWWLFKPATVVTKPMVAVKTGQQPPVTNKPDSSDITNKVNAPAPAIATPKTPNATIADAGVKRSQSVSPVYARVAPKHTSPVVTKTPVDNRMTDGTQATGNNKPQQNIIAKVDAPPADNRADAPVTTGNNVANKTVADGANVIASTASADKPATADAATNNPVIAPVKKPKVSAAGFKPQFGLAIMASPDINGVGSFQNSKVGTNIGLLFSVGISRKLTISTGAAYSKKPYLTDFADYYAGYKFKTDPQDVMADCRVLDIPLNVDYKLYNKSHNSFSVGTGLSSYLMLREKYTYDYAVPGTTGPASYTVVNKNRHYFGVLNLNATYEHQLNTRFSVAAQPYLKMPLTDIGNGRVKLQSAGVALGVRWNIGRSITP